jgi:hypothetical protein
LKKSGDNLAPVRSTTATSNGFARHLAGSFVDVDAEELSLDGFGEDRSEGIGATASSRDETVRQDRYGTDEEDARSARRVEERCAVGGSREPGLVQDEVGKVRRRVDLAGRPPMLDGKRLQVPLPLGFC